MKKPDPLRMTCGDEVERFACAQQALTFARDAGFTALQAAQIALCVAELVSNVAKHGGGRGTLEVHVISEPAEGVRVMVEDCGPGIDDFGAARADGFSRGAVLAPDARRADGLGTGLGAAARAMDDLRFEAREGGGSRIIARKFLERWDRV